MNKEQIIKLAEKALAPHQPGGYRMTIVRDGVQKIDGIWHVAVKPSREDVRSYDFNARLSEAAVDLMKRKDVYIQFTTVIPQHAD
jgi:hypothetical protein